MLVLQKFRFQFSPRELKATEHVKTHKHDFMARRGLMQMACHKRLLKYSKEKLISSSQGNGC